MKVKKIISNIILGGSILSLSISLFGCSKSNEIESTLSKDTLIVGMDDAFAPMGFKDEKGEIVGFDIDMAKEMVKLQGLTLI